MTDRESRCLRLWCSWPRSTRRRAHGRSRVGRRILRAQALPALDLLLLRLDHLGGDIEKGRAQRAGLDVARHRGCELGRGFAPGAAACASAPGELQDHWLARLDIATL